MQFPENVLTDQQRNGWMDLFYRVLSATSRDHKVANLNLDFLSILKPKTIKCRFYKRFLAFLSNT